MTAKEMNDDNFINFQDDFYNLLEKYGVGKIDIEHPQFNNICNLRNKVAEFIEQEVLANSYDEAVDIFLSGGGTTDDVDSSGGNWECIQKPTDDEEQD